MKRDVSPTVALLQWKLITAAWVSEAIYVVMELGVPDLLGDRSLGISELARAASAHEDSLYRLLRGLSTAGLFTESDGKVFALTPLGSCLRTDREDRVHAMAMMFGEEHRRAWRALGHAVRTGETAFEHAYQTPLFEHLARTPRAAHVFQAAMADHAALNHAAVLAAYDFSRPTTVVDVGGGDGTLAAMLLERHPEARAVVFDLERVVDSARVRFASLPFRDRCAIVGGDFFEAVPAGGDVYVVSAVLHNWDDARSLRILETVRAAMRPGTALLVAEMVVPRGGDPFFSKLLDLDMMVMCSGGRERTEGEFRDLLNRAGFVVLRVPDPGARAGVIEAVAR